MTLPNDRNSVLLQFAMFMQARDARTEDGPTGVTWETIGPIGQEAYLQDAEMYLSAMELFGYRPAAAERAATGAVRNAIADVLVLASNYPDRVAVRMLGQDMNPLIEKVYQAVARVIPTTGEAA